MPVKRDDRKKKSAPPRRHAATPVTPRHSAGSAPDPHSSAIQHIFVLMLENRSFDQMLGFSGITGTDAVTGAPTAINGLKGTESNTFSGQTFAVHRGAAHVMPYDPGHEFEDVLAQLCGPAAKYENGGKYPPVNNTGYVAAASHAAKHASPGEVMKCYTPDQLPVLTALAKEFVVCDNWFASLPGPTWPNRMFAHAGSSGGLDHSPSSEEIVEWELGPFGGFEFKHGSIFHALKKAKIRYGIYAGDDFPMVAALKGISIFDPREFEHFAKDLQNKKFDMKYIFIEPSYDVFNEYKHGTSQHPLGNVTHGEALIKATYEAIRKSPVWEKSMLIITWDEHGGFYDHADSGSPLQAVAPGDTTTRSKHNQHGFTFEHFGPRVPAVVISPLVPKNLIDHRVYDHSSIPATVERTFKLPALTKRDAAANGLNMLVSLKTARTDTPMTVPSPAAEAMARVMAHLVVGAHPVVRPDAPVNEGNLPAILASAMRQDILTSKPAQRQAIVARMKSIQTRADALQYMKEVQQKVREERQKAPARRAAAASL
jgi:phospholipase C